MPNFTAGTTFGANDTVTNTKLNNLIADASINPEYALSINSGTIGTLSCTKGTITNLSATTSTFLGAITGSTNVVNIGSGQIYKAASGNVGIGTTSPAEALHVSVAGGNNFAGIRSQNNNAGTGIAGIEFSSDATYSKAAIGLIRSNFSGVGSIVFYNSSSTGAADWSTSDERLRIDSSGSLILAGSTAQKATGTTWSNPSDVRIKKNIRDYEKGLTSLMQVRVREWEYNGKAGTVKDSKNIGVVADEIENVLPDTVSTYTAKLNEGDENDSQIKKFDASEVTWLLVKSLQELKAENDSLKSRIEALEAK
jgi:hypothetical protein